MRDIQWSLLRGKLARFLLGREMWGGLKWHWCLFCLLAGLVNDLLRASVWRPIDLDYRGYAPCAHSLLACGRVAGFL